MAAKFKECVTLFAVQFFSYCIICISFIALSKGSYVWTFVTDLVCGLNSFYLIKKVANTEAKNTLAICSFVLGGASGSMLAIWLTKLFI
jgi:hypothetical protein